ncbi:MAG: rRNA maturation RNase YbeY [Candidatus Magasanikbacteria bacterium]
MACTVYTKVHTSPVSEVVIKKSVDCILDKEKHSDCSVNIHIVGDAMMKHINGTYRNIHRTTDVLSFAIHDGASFPGIAHADELGDIFISARQIKRQALAHHVSAKEEFMRMLVHGVLHLLGYDHTEERVATRMFARQEKLVKLLL